MSLEALSGTLRSVGKDLADVSATVEVTAKHLETIQTMTEKTVASQRAFYHELDKLAAAAGGFDVTQFENSEGFAFYDPKKPYVEPDPKKYTGMGPLGTEENPLSKFGWAEGRSGGFLTAAYAQQLVQNYAEMMKKWNEALAETMPHTALIGRGMSNLAMWFRQFFPQYGDGNIEALAKELLERTSGLKDAIATSDSNIREAIAVTEETVARAHGFGQSLPKKNGGDDEGERDADAARREMAELLDRQSSARSTAEMAEIAKLIDALKKRDEAQSDRESVALTRREELAKRQEKNLTTAIRAFTGIMRTRKKEKAKPKAKGSTLNDLTSRGLL
jgi:hypothetical protein